MELSKCVILLLNILLYSGRIDFVFLHNVNEGSSKGSETDGYAQNVENLVNDKRTINTLKKINNGARQVMNTITSKLVRHASDKITKHVGNIIRSSVSSKKANTEESGQVRSPNPLSSTTSVVLPALSISKLNEKGYENTSITASGKDLKSAEANAGNVTSAENKSNDTTPLNNTSQATNLSSNAFPDNITTTHDHSFTIKYDNDAGDAAGAKQNSVLANADINNNTANSTDNLTTNSTVSKSNNGTKYSDVPIIDAILDRDFHRSEISQLPSPAVSSFVNAPPIGPMETISIDLKGKATTFKNFSKDNREHELSRPSKTEILNFENNPELSEDNIVKRDNIARSSMNYLYEEPMYSDFESTLVKRSPSKASSPPFQPISSSRSSLLPSPDTSKSNRSETNGTEIHEGHKSTYTDEGDDTHEDGSSGESGDEDDDEINTPPGGKKKYSHNKQNTPSVESTKKVTPIRKVPILTITGVNIKSLHPSTKVTPKKRKHKSAYSKNNANISNETLFQQHKKKHQNKFSSAQRNRYKVYNFDDKNGTEMFDSESGMVDVDLASLMNNTSKIGPSDKTGIHSIELVGEHKPGEQATFPLGHGGFDEIPMNSTAKMHVGPGAPGIDLDNPKEKLRKGEEQGPLLPGHDQGPLLVGQDHPADFSHHNSDVDEKGEGGKKWNHHVQPSGPNFVEEPLQVPPVPAEINPGIPNAVNNFPGGSRLSFNLPSSSPILSLQGLVQAPLNSPPLLREEEKACAHHPPLALPEGTLDCPPHSDYPYHQSPATNVSPHNEETFAPTSGPPTLPFEIPSHHKFEKLGHNIEPELLSVIESNNQQVTSLSHEVKNIESRLGNVESIVEVLEKAVYRIEEKVDKLNNAAPTYTQREEFSSTEEPPHNPRHPIMKQYFVPISSGSSYDGIKEIDRNSNGGLPWPISKVVSYLLQEIQRSKTKPQPLLQLQGTPHVPLPQPEMAYPPKEHDIDRLEYELGRTPKSKFGQKVYHYETESPCPCENGGECNGRSDGCDCPLRFTGPRCERPVPRSSLLDSIIDEIPADTQQQYLAPKKTSLITLPLVISENNDDQDPIAQKTVGEVNQSKLVNLLSQFFSPEYLQRLAKREKVGTRRYVKYPIEKEK